MIALYILYGLAIAPSTYFVSYFFKSFSSAMVIVLFLNLCMIIFTLLDFALSMLKSTCRAMKYIDYVLMILPGYSFGTGIMRMSILESLPMLDGYCDAAHGVTVDFDRTYISYEWSAVGRYLFSLGLQFVVYGILAVGADYVLSYPKIHQTCIPDRDIPKREYEDDDDVKNEADRVRNGISHCKNRDYK